MREQIYECCKELRLSAALAENAMTMSGNSNQDYLLNILRSEIQYRSSKRRNLCLKQAGFDSIKTFDGYCFEKISLPATLSVDLIKQLDFMNRQENLILYGRNGAGKSHMATAIGVEACMQGKKVKFYKTATLVNELIDAKSNGLLLKFQKKISKLDLLICDEWGYLPFDAEGSQLLFQVIADCYEKRSLIITTNIEFSKWNGIFYNDQLTAALIDRLVHHSYLIVFDRDSWRFEHSLMKEKPFTN
jgi:DNA replication protein DnaC